MKHPRSHPAFTLIELLVSIGIIAVLVAIAIPAMAHARRAARFGRSLSDCRQMMQMIGFYTQASRGTHPYITADRFESLADQTQLGPNNGLSPGAQTRRWHMMLIDEQPEILDLVYPQIEFWPDLRIRGNETGDYQAGVIATATLFAAPAYFSNTQPLQESQLRATRTSEIRYPAAKMILNNWSSTWLTPQRVIDHDPDGLRVIQTYAFGDGSADSISGADFNAPFVDRTYAGWIGSGFTTLDGLAGRDR